MNQDNCLKVIEQVVLRKEEAITLETVRKKAEGHESTKDSIWQHITPKANLKHFDRKISTAESNCTVDRYTLQTVQESYRERESIFLTETNIDGDFVANKISDLGANEKTNEIIVTDDVGGSRGTITKNEKTAEHAIQNVVNERKILAEDTSKIEHELQDTTKTKNVKSCPSKEKHSDREVEEREGALSNVSVVAGGKLNYALFPNILHQTADHDILDQDLTVNQLQRYLEDELFESEKSLTKIISSSFNANQEQEIDFDGFVEISLEEKGPSNDATFETIQETSSIPGKTHGKLCCLIKCFKRLQCGSSTKR